MSVSFKINPETHGVTQQSDPVTIPSFVAKQPRLQNGGIILIQVIPPQGDIVWTTGSIVTQPR
jgi:hypothetical protein